jgi:hypothetical protein
MTLMRAWSDPIEAPKSTSAPKNVPCMMAAILLQARSMVLLRAPASPMRVRNLGLLRREKVCVAIHSSSLCVPLEVAQPVGDQEVECKLKSPMIIVGIVASRSSPRSELSAEGSATVTDLQGPPSERTQSDKIRDLKSLAKQYARDQGSCDDTRISYLEYVESEAEADWTLARMIAG